VTLPGIIRRPIIDEAWLTHPVKTLPLGVDSKQTEVFFRVEGDTHIYMKVILTRCLVVFVLVSCCCPLMALACGRSDFPFAFAVLVAPDIRVDRLTAVEHAVADAQSSGDNRWMLTSSALCL
jgi:hypothetical protein